MSNIEPVAVSGGGGVNASIAASRNYVLGVLVVVYTFNFVDRQILSILIEPIKAELGLSDTQIGLLSGFAFAAFYATLGIPIARLADRSNRRNLIALSLLVWSGMTAMSGLVTNFWQMLVARIGVGIGEAGCSPAAHSMVSDYFPPQQRATALGIYSLGIPVGILFGFLAGGWINEFFGWRIAFFVVGLPGLALALVVWLTVKEPPRGMAEQRADVVAPPGMFETFAYLMAKPAFRHLAAGGALTAFVGYSYTTWLPSFLSRSYGMQTGEIGTWLGLILGIPGGIGITLGGWLADRYGSRDTRWYLWIVAVALLASVPFAVGVFLAPGAGLALLLLCLPVMLGNFYQATSFSQTQGLSSLRMRAVAAAVFLFIVNLVGLGAGPYVTGAISDALEPTYGVESLRWALLCVTLVNVWAALHYFLGGRHLERDLASAAAGR